MSLPQRMHPSLPVEIWLVLLALALVLLVGLVGSSSASTFGGSPSEIDAVEQAVLHVVTNGIPEHKIRPWSNHPIARSPIKLRAFAAAVVFAGSEHDIDPYLLTAIAFREGSFGMDRVGKIGEVSAFQITPRTLRVASRWDARCSVEDYQSAALCASVLLSHWRERCGSIDGAVSMYASGRTCNPDTARLAWIVRDRLGIARRLRDL